jgi:hypothetical protein
MLTDDQIIQLSHKMGVPLERCCFKDELFEHPLVYNRSYVVNMQDSLDEEGNENEGTHWVCFQVNEDGTKKQAIYFDPYGVAPPKVVTDYIKKFVGTGIPHTTKDIQSIMANCCGWYCLAFLHYINEYANRRKDLYDDTAMFLNFFDDLNKSIDYKKNEFMLRQFFRPSDPEERKKLGPIDLSKDFIAKDDCDIKNSKHIPSI